MLCQVGALTRIEVAFSSKQPVDWFLSSLEVLDLSSSVNTVFVCDRFIKNGATPGIELLPWNPTYIKAFQVTKGQYAAGCAVLQIKLF